MATQGKRFGQKPRPLIEDLKGILERYPDGGQILKELIQNADDAGAEKVFFVYDPKEYSTKNLLDEKLKPFQGPSLLVYNDAIFTDEDWDNIEMLGRSYKKSDPFKVGRFGLGFNAVYHLTDLPMILSGDRFGVLEPSEELFLVDGVKSSGMAWSINQLMRQDDQFSPFREMIDRVTQKRRGQIEKFPGTIFRFPLRKQSSKMSKTVYGEEKIEKLFESFKLESKKIILFLNNVRSIKVTNLNQEKNSLLIMSIFDDTNSNKAQREFVQERTKNKICGENLVLASSSPTVQSWDIIVTTKEGSRTSSQDKWKITSYISGSRSVDDEIEELAPEVHSFPQISVATNISKTEALEGEIFCCLPLPFGAEAASTGLPAHVNGSFGLTDNRRDVKWKGIDQTNDLNARWNEALICTVLPSAYQCHIQSMIDSNLGSQEVYRCLPSIEEVKKNWKPAMKPLFDKLFDETPIFWTKANHGNWLKLSESWFMEEDYYYCQTKMSGVARKFLSEVGVNSVELPQHVFEAINEFEGVREINLVNPSTLYPYFRSNADHLDSESRENKLLLLEYCLSTSVDKNCLQGIRLLPLADGTFGTFQTRNSHDVFLDSPEHPRILLPNLKDWFVEEDVETNVWKKLMDLAKKQFYQLKIFQPDYFQTNLKRALPQKWFAWITESTVNWTPGRNEEPTREWLQKLWSYLRKHFSRDLSQFHKFPIVPVRLGPTPILGYLGKEYKIMFRGKSMPQEISTSLQRDFSCVIIDDTPEFFNHNSLSNYIYSQSPSDILDFLTKQNSPSEIMRNFSDDLKDKWCQYLSNISSASYTEIPVLKSLPIFKAFQSSDRNHHFFINLKDNTPTYLEPKHVSDWIPGGIPFERPMVSRLGNGASEKLATLVGCKTLTMDELLMNLMDTFNRFTSAQKDCLALWILNKTRFYNFKSLHSYLATLEVVPSDTTIDQRKTPKELFNPQNSELQNLFVGEIKFPSQHFSSNDVLMALAELGLRNEPNFNEVYESALILHQSCNVMEIQNSKKKSKAIVLWLEKLLQRNNVSYHVSNNIRHVAFLEIQKEKPLNYPPSLEWAGSSNSQTFMCPNECWEQSKLELIASSIPVIRQAISPQLSHLFGWNIQKLGNVVQHMGKLSGLDKSKLSSNEIQYVKRMSKKIYEFLKSLDETEINWILEQFSSFKWIWNGEGFSSPDTIVIDTQGIDLRPHAYSVLEDFKSFGDLFLKAGAHQTNSEAFLIGVLHSIKAVHDMPDSKSCKKDLEIVISILKWLGDQKIKNDQILLPIQTSDQKLLLKPINDCTYSESFIGGFFEMDDEKEIYIAHHDISKNLAQSLGVQSQTKQLLKADSFGFEAYGQNEPLTQRIKNILDEYPDNMGIFKEMIQNADDAGASEVAFVIDHRTNDNQSRLMNPGMAACHGSALWSYNNSVFTDNDFANIQKLGGQTKKDIVEKIGRFGLGFNSVYHLTDVPSFVSGPFVAIFDPYTTHLNDIINDKTKPGVKINFVDNKNLSNMFPDQFKPYQDLFGCKISTSPEPFDGTLFRLPFRQKPQTVDKIQMSPKTYSDESKIKALIKELVECPDVLLLFAQNVTKVTLFEIPHDETNLKEGLKEILKIEKKVFKTFQVINTPGLPCANSKNPEREQTNILSHAKRALSSKKKLKHIICSHVFEIFIQKSESNLINSTKWLVTNAVGNSEALDFARNDDGKKQGLMPCGGVAVRLDDKDETLIPTAVEGQIFCFLPLSIPSGLPVHVNGSFAVASNRKNLWRVSQEALNNCRGLWNQKLMADAVSLAYMEAIKDITNILEPELKNEIIEEWTKGFRSIFPSAREKNPNDEIDHLTHSLFKKIDEEKAEIFPVVSINGEKLNIEWFQATSEDLQTTAFFGPIHFLGTRPKEKSLCVPDILIDLGFNLVHHSFDSLGSSFRNTDVKVVQTKPSIVIQFLKNCRLKQSLPKRLQETEMLSLDRLINLMTYCLSEKVIIKKDESNNLTLSKQDTHHKKEPEEVSLDGLPLLLTKDNILRVFDEPVFESKYCNLVPAQYCRFLNTALQHLFSNHSVFGKKFELSDLQTMEQYIKDEMKNPKWILLFWKFLSDKMDTNKTVKLHPEQVEAMIPNWEVIPSRRGNYPNQEKKMMPFKNSKEIIIVSKVDERKGKILSILRKLNCWELDFESLEKFQKVPQYPQTYSLSTPSTLAFTDLASKFTSSLDDYDGLCEVLGSLDIPLGYLDSEESKTLLEYFEHEAPKLKPESLELLKTLPVFETIFGGHVPVSQHQIWVLEWNIPGEGLNVWLPGSGSIFLKHHFTLPKLYEKMGFKEITVLKLYQQYIFHWLQNMDDVSLMVHLKKLMDIITIFYSDSEKVAADLAPLKSYNLIGPNSFRRRVSEFFDPNESDFKILLPPHLLLPDEYNEIIPLLKFIGLNSKLTQETFLAIAKDIENQGPSPPNAINRGKLLVRHLYKELRNLHQSDKLHFSSLCKIASIKFIDAHIVPSALSKLHPQFSQKQLICFAEAITCEQENKTWTCSHLLPSWAKPSYKEIANFLKIFLEPPTEKVVEHCKNLCSSLSDRKKLETTEKENSEDLCRKLIEVMKDNYRFLSKHTDEPIIKELSKINCILVENGRKLIMPSKVVMEMSDDLKPYLYKFPLEMGEFQTLFRALGTTEKPTLNQLSIVLASIHRDIRGEPLSPEERRIASKAISSFFTSFKEQGSESCNEIQILYLLSKKDVLLNSNKMMFNDEPKFTGRLSNTSNECEEPGHLMLDLKLLKQLPVQLRPKFLSGEVHEKLCTEATDICPSQSSSCKLKNEIEKLISDHFFQEGLKRIFWHVCNIVDKEFSDDVMMKALEKICEIQLECRPRIESELINTINGQVVPESKKDLRYFVDEDKILIHHDEGDRFKIAEIMSTKIVDIFKDYIDLIECQHIIHHILANEDPTNIQKILEEESIEHLNAQLENKNRSVTLTLGQVIEDHLKHLLQQNPSHYFKTEELVGFEKDGVCILAKVLCELDEDEFEQRSNMGKKYLINVGSSETVVASALDLYKFVRRHEDEVDSKDEIKIESFDVEDEIPSSEDSSFEVELYPGNEDSRTKTNSSQFDEATKDEKKPKFDDLPSTLEKAKDEIDEMLTEAWKLPEAEKNKAIKRLFLRWHPDKNPGKDALCTEAFKYLMNQLEHMKKSGSLNKDRSNASTESSSRSYDDPFWSYYGDFFKKWDSEAKQQGRQRNRHRQGRGYGFGARGNQPKSNPKEANRWMEQAKSDLANAKQTLNESSHDLTCFAAQQASEKALKALLLFIDGDLQSSHQLIYLAKRVEMRCPTKHQRFLRGIVDMAKQLSSIGQSGGDSDNLYDRSKCPSAHNSPQIPATAFQRENAEIAIKLAEEIVQKASDIIF